MKNAIALLLLSFFLIGCTYYHAPGKESVTIVENYVQQTINNKDSYVSLGTWIYPAYWPKDDPAWINEIMNKCTVTNKLVTIDSLIKLNRKDEAKALMIEIAHNEYERKELYSIKEKKELFSDGKQNKCIGWRVQNKYQALDDTGLKYTKTVELILDPQMEKILSFNDLNDKMYQLVRQLMSPEDYSYYPLFGSGKIH